MVEKTLAEVEKKIAVRRHYDNFIGGKWVPPVRGQKFDNISPIDGSVVCTIARSTAEDIELALDAAHAAKDALGPRRAGRSRARPQQDRRPDGREAGSPCSRRGDRQWQADPRDQGRRPAAGGRSFSLLRRLHARPGRQLERDRPRHGRLPFPRAAGRGRADHSRGTSPCSWPRGSWRRRWPQGTAWC